MNMMQVVKLRLEAIAIVLAHQFVLTSEQYIDAMAHAVALTEGPGGRYDSIPPAVFGGNETADLYAARLERADLMRILLMEDKAPKWFRESFTKEWNRDFVEYNEIVVSWNAKTEDFEGVQPIPTKQETGKLGKKNKS